MPEIRGLTNEEKSKIQYISGVEAACNDPSDDFYYFSFSRVHQPYL